MNTEKMQASLRSLIAERKEKMSLSDARLARKALAEKIIALFKDYGYPFGGYLRDEIAGEDFTDLDMYFPMARLGYNFIGDWTIVSTLKKLGYVVEDLGEESKYIVAGKPGKGKVNCRKFSVTDRTTGAAVKLDYVSSSTDRVNDDHPFASNLDADVNALWRDQSGQLTVAPNMTDQFTVASIKNNIAKRKYQFPEGSDVAACVARGEKLRAKGYEQTQSKTSASNHAQSKTPARAKIHKESKGMSEGLSFMEQFKKDAETAAYQSVGTQVTKAAKEGILAAMKGHGADEGAIAGFTKILDTPAGEAAISALLGHGLPHAPMIGDDERVQRLAEHMRVNGYAACMNIIFSVLMQYMLPGIQKALESLPAPSTKSLAAGKVRVKADAEVEDESEDEEPAAARKQAR